jgi:hypothetical protein
MRRNRRSRTKEQLWASARLALVAPDAPRAAPALLSERATDRILRGPREDAATPRTATTSVGSKNNEMCARAICNSAPMRYTRTLYDGAQTPITRTRAANDPYCGMVKSRTGSEGAGDAGTGSAVGAESAIDAPGQALRGYEMLATGLVALRASCVMARISTVDPALTGARVTPISKPKGQASMSSPSSAGGGGVAAPWGILALLAARAIRAPWGRGRAGARLARDRSSSGVIRVVGE